ncbi:urease accessory protein UreJ [Vibrio sp. SM6]|uniref:Urease accessory protein UreJ n=1 Tax=Vibrio agarilyticus TaxID=2726741 RepID=A0A7X8YIJ6_9VIBR|nr:HupE/UreJ family protein [Vibrio agarilyticus]NLS14695.1 urease accessory protein UreJ [Vibrio agarilyticus]
MTTKKRSLASLIVGACALAPSLAMAHPGHDTHSWMAGALHSLTGTDHLIALVSFGLVLAAVATRFSHKLIIAAFGLLALLSGLISGQHFGAISLVEPMIIGSLVVASLCLWVIALPNRVTSLKKGWQSKMADIALVGAPTFLLFFHGYAHGVEASGSVTQFGFGMMVTAALLMASGATLFTFARTLWWAWGISALSSLALLA